MTATVRAKFRCSLARMQGEVLHVAMQPVYTGSEENKAFWAATPAGSLDLWINNPAAHALFVEGQEYYLDIAAAPPGA